MTPEQEIARIQRDFKDHWHELEDLPAIQKAVADNDPIKLGQEVAKIVHGERWVPTRQEVEHEQNEYHPKRAIVSVNKLQEDWPDKAYLAFRQGNHVNLENFKHPDDLEWCERVAEVLGAKGSMKPDKTVFFFRHSN